MGHVPVEVRVAAVEKTQQLMVASSLLPLTGCGVGTLTVVHSTHLERLIQRDAFAFKMVDGIDVGVHGRNERLGEDVRDRVDQLVKNSPRPGSILAVVLLGVQREQRPVVDAVEHGVDGRVDALPEDVDGVHVCLPLGRVEGAEGNQQSWKNC